MFHARLRNNLQCFLQSTQAIPTLRSYPSQVRVRNTVFSGTGFHRNGTPVSSVASIILTDTPFVLNNTANKFTVIGCNSLGLLYPQDVNITTGCLSVCNDKRRDVTSGHCSGLGCCQDSIPEGTRTIHVEIIENLLDDSKIKDLYNVSTPHTCGYAFVVEQESYRFEASDLDRCSSSKIESSSLVLDWVIGNETCEAAGTSCKGMNSDCVGFGYGSGSTSRGYRCRCKDGYVGNPYLSSGCPDKDVDGQSHRQGNGTCSNSFGSYSCSFPLPVVLVFGCLLFVILLAPSVYMCTKRRELMNLKQKYFRQNGGFLLIQQIAFHEGSGEPTKIFTTQELAEATDDYAESRVVGRGGSGTVYKGTLCNSRVIAVKKSRMVDRNRINEFINEVVVLTQINHRNVVKLLGCCLETEVPLLVYEYVPNESLHYHIHNPSRRGLIPWEDRLRIATGTASALAYLHSAVVVPIIHRDIKSSNILLEDNYTAKVADFGASRLIPADQSQITTLVKGTLGYLDPEYFQTNRLTEKSDVYSFGVVLAELLTGQLPVSSQRPEAQNNLSSYFIQAMQQGRLVQILEPRLANERNIEQLEAIADLAMRCLRLKGEERPTMKEVVLELAGSRRIYKHPWHQVNREETRFLLDEKRDILRAESSSVVNLYSDISFEQYSINSCGTFSMDLPR
ncbi:hypothetical protein F3Y22_tig00004111pilonHSYRG00102 [Hibiscus syriacus]|uniref:Protein kinase domain-containing protein n=1 Tax=Hibiscus syriacus TaxID=106335 RepID=A0A6A3CHE1_HIBSY|nr:hypothetical protein F3Y22_tig00004111pilonHSYRG00102 [Hibiscus syriacus]